jgi:hypothetical protein
MIHVRHGASVHENLLHNISLSMDAHLERYLGSEDSQEEPCLLPDPCELSSRRAVEMWTGFLYGQPMWTLRGEDTIKEDFQALIAVYSFARLEIHHFAQDAALDAIRVILHDHSDVLGDLLPTLIELYEHFRRFQLLARTLMDFTVFRGSAEVTKRWSQWAESEDDGEDEQVSALKRNLYVTFGLKAANERGGHDPPRLMLACVYHSHLATERPCYLGDRADLGESDAQEPGVWQYCSVPK